MPNKNTYQLFFLLSLQIFFSISIDSLEKYKNIFEVKIEEFKTILLNLDSEKNDFNYKKNLELLIIELKKFLEIPKENQSEENILSVLTELSFSIDEKKFNFCLKLLGKKQNYKRFPMILFLQTSSYFKIIKAKNLIQSTFLGQISTIIDKSVDDNNFIEYFSNNQLFFIKEINEIKRKSNLIKKNFLARNRISSLYKKENNANLPYKETLISLLERSPNISDKNITDFLKFKDTNKLLPLDKKDGSFYSRIFVGKGDNKNTITQISFYPNHGFLEEKIKLSDSFYSKCVVSNLNQAESFFYLLIAIRKNNSDAIVNYLFTDEEEITCIQNYIIFSSKYYWESEKKKEDSNNNLQNNSNLANSSIKFLTNQLQDKDKNDTYPSLILITNDKEFALKLDIIEKNNPKNYSYKAILLNSDNFTSILSTNLDLKNNKIFISNENQENQIIDLTKDILKKTNNTVLEIKNLGQEQFENKLNKLLSKKKKLKIATTRRVFFVGMGLGALGLLSFNKLKTGNFFPKEIYSFFTEKRFLTEKKITLV